LVSFGLAGLTFLTMNPITQARPAADVGPDLHTAKYTTWPLEPLVEPGGMITFSILIENLGTSQGQGVIVTDTLSADLTYVGSVNNLCGGPCPVQVNGQQVIWQLGNLPADTQWQYIEMWARVNPAVAVGALLTNTVEIRGQTAEIDSNPNDEISDPYANNQAELTMQVISPTADLQIYKDVEAGVAAAGESLPEPQKKV
jgi:uncharacterized repeat protein (TIGR01451 family)